MGQLPLRSQIKKRMEGMDIEMRATTLIFVLLLLLVGFVDAGAGLTEEQWRMEKALLMEQLLRLQQVNRTQSMELQRQDSLIRDFEKRIGEHPNITVATVSEFEKQVEEYRGKYEYYRARSDEYEAPGKRWRAWNDFVIAKYGVTAEEYWRARREPGWFQRKILDKWLFWLYFVSGGYVIGGSIYYIMKYSMPRTYQRYRRIAEEIFPQVMRRKKSLLREKLERMRETPMWRVDPAVMPPALSSRFKSLARVRVEGGKEVIEAGDTTYGHLIWASNCLASDTLTIMRALDVRPHDRMEFTAAYRRVTGAMLRLAEQKGTEGEQRVWKQRASSALTDSDEIKKLYDAYTGEQGRQNKPGEGEQEDSRADAGGGG